MSREHIVQEQDSTTLRWFFLVCTIAFIVRFCTAILFPNIFWSDEIFQTLEPAHKLVFGQGITAWEYKRGVRSWLFPGVLAAIMKVFSWLGEGSFPYLAAIQAFLSFLALGPVVLAFTWAKPRFGGTIALLLSLAMAIWFECLFFAPKALFEVVAIHLLCWALVVGFLEEKQTKGQIILAGVLCGLVLSLRVHLAPAILMMGLWSWKQHPIERRRFFFFALGGVFVLVGLLDAITWTYPFQSFWMIFYVNIIEKVSHKMGHGIQPWYEYFRLYARVYGWSLLFFLPLTFVAWKESRDRWLFLLAASIFIPHCFIGLKLYRLVFPATVLFLLIACIGAGTLLLKIKQYKEGRYYRLACILFLGTWAMLSLLLGQSFNNEQTMLRFDKYTTSHWVFYRGSLLGFQQLSTTDDVCGVGLWGINPEFSGGYSHLHKDVSLHFLKSDYKELPRKFLGFNYLLTRLPAMVLQHSAIMNLGFREQQCWGKVCLFKRQGSCIVRKKNKHKPKTR